jgi:5-methylcytosine-specific restriction protein A
MTNTKRVFRGTESIAAERISRDAVEPFLTECGFQVLEDRRNVAGSAIEQFVTARAPDGQSFKMRVRLCWRRDGRKTGARQYAAAQLRARLVKNSWGETLDFIVDRDRHHGNTHNLIIQRDGAAIVHAALIPVSALKQIWERQCEVSDDLHRRGLMERINKNHAKNGSSPTIWLQDDRTPDAHQVADVLWAWPDVVDLLNVETKVDVKTDDTFDDCPDVDPSLLGSDGAERRSVLKSAVRRDPRVRQAVQQRTQVCENDGCGMHRKYQSFLDVHHILGADKGDRIWNCVALCPNCHRDAHFAPNADSLNTALLAYAEQFKSS